MSKRAKWNAPTARKRTDEDEAAILLPSQSTNTQSISCPICKADSYLNKHLKLLVPTPCCHRMCESCVYRLFSQGAAGCPVCGISLRKTSFSEPQFEDLSAEKEYRIRKQLMKWFNKRREDFETLNEFNDYLEDVEDMIFNLVHQIDIEKTNARVEHYKRSNHETILKNAMKQTKEAQAIWSQVKTENEESQRRKDADSRELELERLEQEKARADLVQELATSKKPALDIVHEFQSRTTATLKKSSAKRISEDLRDSASDRVSDEMKRKLLAKSDSAAVSPVGSPLFDYLKKFGCHEVLTGIPFVYLAENYDDPLFNPWKIDKTMIPGGYVPGEVYTRALEYAFAQILLPPL